MALAAGAVFAAQHVPNPTPVAAARCSVFRAIAAESNNVENLTCLQLMKAADREQRHSRRLQARRERHS